MGLLQHPKIVLNYQIEALAKWLLEFLGIPRNKGVNFHSKFGLGIPNHNNSGSKSIIKFCLTQIVNKVCGFFSIKYNILNYI